ELHCLSNFTFLRGASHPHELVEQADSLGYAALAITDECSVAGVVRAHMAAQDRRLKLIIGSEFRLVCGLKLVALAIDRRGYGRLCRLITRGRRAAGKGHYSITRAELEAAGLEQCFILWLPAARPSPEELRWLAGRFPDRVRIAVELLREGSDRERLAALAQIGAQCRGALRALLPRRSGHRRLRAPSGDSVSGQGLGGELARVLLPGGDLGGPAARRGAAVRALHLARAQRAARHRHRFRARAARGGAAVRLSQVRSRARRARRDRHHVPAAQRAARPRQGLWPRCRRQRPAGEGHAMVGWERGDRATRARRRLRSLESLARAALA